ncbi:MAG TPA: CBS domain-containing protein, partial [Candidatus Limnocylindrales bacterium]
VAVMQVGGVLAQFGPPAEILASPASEFVARFVGTDRGLKRLSLARVGDLPGRSPVTARPGDAAGPARARILADPFPYLLLVDDADRPIGWVDQADVGNDGGLGADDAIPMSPLLNRRTTLKDALSLLIEADVQAGILVDRDGRVAGIVTAGMIMDWVREQGRGEEDGVDAARLDETAAAAARA